MKTKNFWAIAALTVGLVTTFSACTSDDLSDASLTATVQDEAQISSISDEVITDADEYVNANLMSVANAPASEMQKLIGPKGATVTVVNEGNPFPKVITIDYGTEGITGKRGNVFRGKIIVRVTNRMDVTGSSRNYSFDNFSVNENKVKGWKTVTYIGANPTKKWTVAVSDTIVKASDSRIIISNSTRIRTRISDNDTPNLYYDDKYSIEGSATGINAKGVTYTMTITKALVTDGVWPVFVEGTMLLETEKRSVVTDYGDGTRDMKATVTVNGVTKTIYIQN
jgi:hypothetical protein